MKKIYKILLTLTFTFLFMGQIEAKSYLELDCPTSAGTNKTTTCTVYAKSDTNAELTNINADGVGKVSKVSYKAIKNEISGAKEKVGTISITTSSETGTAKINISMNIGENYVETSKNITIKSSSNTLSSLTANGISVLNGKTITTTNQTVTIKAVASHSTSKITGTGTKNLSCGLNTYKITVTSQIGTTKTYTVTINRNCASTQTTTSGVYLKNIYISSGTLSPTFQKNITTYTVEVSKDIDKITITGIRNSSNQTITGNVENKILEYGTNEVKIKVKQNGIQTTYTINVIRKQDSSSAYLSTLSLSSGTIEFNKKTLEYKTEVPYDTEEIEILAIPESESAKVTITGNKNLKLGENLITIKVKSEESEKTYKITVTRLEQETEKSTNANIKTMTIKNHKFKFTPSKTDYRLILDNETSLEIAITMEDDAATYKIEGNQNLKDGSVIKIITTAEDGTEKNYKIEIIKNSYTAYYIIGAVLLLTIILVPTIVYFVSVKPKQKKTDVNGYKEGKDYDEKDYSRKVINSSKTKEELSKENKVIIDNKSLENPKSINQVPEQNAFDEGLKNYVPNEEQNQQIPQTIINEEQNQNIVQLPTEEQEINQDISRNNCPSCQRELLGNPDECPYCKTKLK